MTKAKKKAKLPAFSISSVVSESLQRYFNSLQGEEPIDLYEMVRAEFEEPLINAVLALTNGVETKAAIILGISRGTLRQRRTKYGHYEGRR